MCGLNSRHRLSIQLNGIRSDHIFITYVEFGGGFISAGWWWSNILSASWPLLPVVRRFKSWHFRRMTSRDSFHSSSMHSLWSSLVPRCDGRPRLGAFDVFLVLTMTDFWVLVCNLRGFRQWLSERCACLDIWRRKGHVMLCKPRCISIGRHWNVGFSVTKKYPPPPLSKAKINPCLHFLNSKKSLFQAPKKVLTSRRTWKNVCVA